MAGVPVLLVTANVGSIFEEPDVMLKIWTEEFLSTISRLDPKFIALHCQEVGGKNYEQSMKHVEDFVRLLMSSEELRLFDKVRVFLDEDFSSPEHFTALGNLYFVHDSLKDVLLWDFKDCTFVPVRGKDIKSGNIEAVTTKEKAKFPQDFFPECKWSRKGFLRTRWSLNGTVFDLINIHLFHDASNFIAMETTPSVYSQIRRRALEHTLDRFHNDRFPNVPYFLFGDFNFRTDTSGVIKKLTADTTESKTSGKGNSSALQYRNTDNDLILTLGKKEFFHHCHDQVFAENDAKWLREFDQELEDFDGRLFEFPITFVPSYPFEEDVNEGTNYMKTRVPAWCDRVLLSPTAKTLVKDDSSPAEYGMIGPVTCMGDHKPVYLRIVLASNAGMINCCDLSLKAEFCFRVPDTYAEQLSMLPDCRSYAHALSVDNSSNLLHAAPTKHDPYTPDSMDSPSPNTIGITGESHLSGGLENGLGSDDRISGDQATRFAGRAHLDRAVSPALLKSKLELIAKKSKEQDTLSIKIDTDKRRRSGSGSALDHVIDDEHQRDFRRSKSNSDVSWQRSHVLTRAWIQDKSQHGYHSFGSNLHRSCIDSNPYLLEGNNHGEGDRVIPSIAIINASNFESNASSVHLHDSASRQSYHHITDQQVDDWYLNSRTRSLSGEDSSQGISAATVEEDELCVQIYEETNDSNVRYVLTQDCKNVINEIIDPLVILQRAELKQIEERDVDEVMKYKNSVTGETSKNATRSNSIQSQDIQDTATNVLKLKAYDMVTKQCKKDIAGKKRRCKKCCAVS